MKNIVKVILTLALALSLLLDAVPTVGALWDFTNGIPEDWEQQDTLEEFRADHLLNPVNPNASQESRNLLAYLQLVGDSQQVIGGQFDISTDDLAYNEVIKEYGYEPTLYSARYVVDVTEPVWELDANGKETAVIANTCMDFTDVDEVNEYMLKHYNNGNVLLIHSDSAPRTLCANAAMKNKPDLYNGDPTDAIIELDATNPDRDMQAYALWIKYQTNVINALKKMEALGVKAYMWRPWVEYNNHAFAGRTAEGYDTFARVYQQTVNMLVDAGLEGFLVTFSPNLYTNILTHNPGTDYIDIYGFTVYSNEDKLGYLVGNDLNANSYEAVKRSGKPLGFTEYSCRTGNWTAIDKQARSSSFDLLRSTLSFWPELAFFDYWGNGSYDTSNNNFDKYGNDDGMLFWSSDYVITLDEAVDYRQGVIQAPGIAQLFKTADASGSYVGLEEKEYSAADLKAMGITASDVRTVRLNQGFAITFWTGDNCTGDFYRYGFSQKGIAADIAKNFKSVSISGLENVAFEQDVYSSVNDDAAWRINDGYPSLWEGDVFDESNAAEKGTAWFYIDLGKAYHVGRYVLKNASFASRAAIYNTVDFQVQYSNDCKNWTTVDTVESNTLGQVNRYFDAVLARYFRVLITNPNTCTSDTEKGVVSVSDFELYGVDPGLLSLTVQTEDNQDPNEGGEDEESSVPEEDGEDTAPEEEDGTEEDFNDGEDIEDGFDEDLDEEPTDDTVIDEVVSDAEDGTAEDEFVGGDDEYAEEPDEEEPGEDEEPVDGDDDEEEETKKKKKVFLTTIVDWTWIIVLIVAAVVVIGGGVVLLIVLKRRKAKKQAESAAE